MTDQIVELFEPHRNEHQEQVVVIMWARLQVCIYPDLELLHAIPNERVGLSQGKKFKAEGVKPGVADLSLPVARGGYFGLYIEMKVKPNRQTKNQKNFQKLVEAQNYKYIVCWNSKEAEDALVEYLSQPRTEVKEII